MSERYELRTIKDIFDKVPADRWDVLFAELLVMLKQADSMRTMYRGMSELVGVDPESGEFDELIVWEDDGNSDLTTVICADGVEVASITTKI